MTRRHSRETRLDVDAEAPSITNLKEAAGAAAGLWSWNRDRRALLRVRQVLAHAAPLQHIAAEEPECADLRDDRPDGEPSLFEKEEVLTSELGRGDRSMRRSVLAKRLNNLDVAANGGSGIVATHQLVAQALQ